LALLSLHFDASNVTGKRQEAEASGEQLLSPVVRVDIYEIRQGGANSSLGVTVILPTAHQRQFPRRWWRVFRLTFAHLRAKGKHANPQPKAVFNLFYATCKNSQSENCQRPRAEHKG